jgi:hypothetical protein
MLALAANDRMMDVWCIGMDLETSLIEALPRHLNGALRKIIKQFRLSRVSTAFPTSFIHQWLYSTLLGPYRFFSFVILYTVGRTPWRGDQPVARPLVIHRTAQTHNKRAQTSMSRVGFEPKMSVFERTETVHALHPRGHCNRLRFEPSRSKIHVQSCTAIPTCSRGLRIREWIY